MEQPFCLSQDCLRNRLPLNSLALLFFFRSSPVPCSTLVVVQLHPCRRPALSALIETELKVGGAPYWVRGAKYSQVSGDHLPQEQLPLRAVERPHLETNIVFLENCPFSRVDGSCKWYHHVITCERCVGDISVEIKVLPQASSSILSAFLDLFWRFNISVVQLC